MRESFHNRFRKKVRLLFLSIILAASISQIPAAALSGRVCQREELGVWTRKATWSLMTKIKIRLADSRWQYFVLSFQQDITEKFKLIFLQDITGIKLSCVGVTSSPDKIPLSIIQQGNESIFSFTKAQNVLLMTISNGNGNHDIRLYGTEFDQVDSVVIKSEAHKLDRGKTIIKICNSDSSESKQTDFSDSSVVACPEAASCKDPAPPCPKPTPCPMIMRPRPCPKATPCPAVIAVSKQTSCPPPSRSPDKVCPAVPNPSPVTCPPISPCPPPQQCNDPNPTVSCSCHQPQIPEDQMTNESKDFVSKSTNNTLGNLCTKILDGYQKDLIIISLAVVSSLLLIITVALGIALYKTKSRKHDKDSAAVPQTDYFPTISQSIPWSSAVSDDAQPPNVGFDIGPNSFYKDSVINSNSANNEEGNFSDFSDEEPALENET